MSHSKDNIGASYVLHQYYMQFWLNLHHKTITYVTKDFLNLPEKLPS